MGRLSSRPAVGSGVRGGEAKEEMRNRGEQSKEREEEEEEERGEREGVWVSRVNPPFFFFLGLILAY